MRLYKRALQIIVGADDGTAVTIEGLYITFEIKKTLSSTPNEGIVRIYNLSDSTETIIKDTGTRIRVKGGYQGEYDLLFDGDIRKVERDRQQQDRITTITLGGNVFAITDAIANVSYDGPVTVLKVIQDTISSFALSTAGLELIQDSMLNDFSFTGRTADLYDQILKPIDIEWYENDGFIQFSEVGNSTETVAVLNSSSGLIGSPSVTDDGVKAISLLNANIRPGGRVKIESELVTGIYKVSQVLYHGDNRDGDFFTEFLGVDSE